jgi:hypothetical protein
MISILCKINRRVRSAFEGLHPHEQLVVCRDVVLCLDLVIEIHPRHPAVGVDLYLLAFHEPAPEGLLAVVVQVEDDFVPPLVQLEGHGALEGFDAGDRLVV